MNERTKHLGLQAVLALGFGALAVVLLLGGWTWVGGSLLALAAFIGLGAAGNAGAAERARGRGVEKASTELLINELQRRRSGARARAARFN